MKRRERQKSRFKDSYREQEARLNTKLDSMLFFVLLLAFGYLLWISPSSFEFYYGNYPILTCIADWLITNKDASQFEKATVKIEAFMEWSDETLRNRCAISLEYTTSLHPVCLRPTSPASLYLVLSGRFLF